MSLSMTNFFVIAIITEAVIILILASFLFWQLRDSARERRDLYTRIQAGTLQEYAALKPTIEPQAVTIPVGKSAVDDDDYAPVVRDIPVETIQSAKSSFDRL
jgi:hypothetical protein